MFKPGRHNLTIIHTKGLILLLTMITGLGIFLWYSTSRHVDDQVALERLGRSRDRHTLTARLDAAEAKLDKLNGYVDKLHAHVVSKMFVLEDDHKRLADRADKIEERLDRMADRLALLGTLHNENFSAVAAGRPKEVIFIGRTWTINRLPRYLNMSKEDVDWLTKFVDRKAAIAETAPLVPQVK